MNNIKHELSSQINKLSDLKREIINSEHVEVAAKSKLRIAIESMLIDLNEEIFSLSEEVANSYQSQNPRALVNHAREFELRKKQLIKKVY